MCYSDFSNLVNLVHPFSINKVLYHHSLDGSWWIWLRLGRIKLISIKLITSKVNKRPNERVVHNNIQPLIFLSCDIFFEDDSKKKMKTVILIYSVYFIKVPVSKWAKIANTWCILIYSVEALQSRTPSSVNLLGNTNWLLPILCPLCLSFSR